MIAILFRYRSLLTKKRPMLLSNSDNNALGRFFVVYHG